MAEFQEQYYSAADLKQFMQTYVPKYAKSYTVHLYGNNEESDPGVEASLDIQVSYMALNREKEHVIYTKYISTFWASLLWFLLGSGRTIHSIFGQVSRLRQFSY